MDAGTASRNLGISVFLPSGFSVGTSGKESAYQYRDWGLIPELGRSPGGGHGNPLQYFCLEYLMDRGAWWAKVHGVAESDRNKMTTHTCMSLPKAHLETCHSQIKSCLFPITPIIKYCVSTEFQESSSKFHILPGSHCSIVIGR